jgi:hypothetical protein
MASVSGFRSYHQIAGAILIIGAAVTVYYSGAFHSDDETAITSSYSDGWLRLTIVARDFEPASFREFQAAVDRATLREALALRGSFAPDHTFRAINREALHEGPMWQVRRDFGAWRISEV